MFGYVGFSFHGGGGFGSLPHTIQIPGVLVGF
jgi:hypothetical protein